MLYKFYCVTMLLCYCTVLQCIIIRYEVLYGEAHTIDNNKTTTKRTDKKKMTKKMMKKQQQQQPQQEREKIVLGSILWNLCERK